MLFDCVSKRVKVLVWKAGLALKYLTLDLVTHLERTLLDQLVTAEATRRPLRLAEVCTDGTVV